MWYSPEPAPAVDPITLLTFSTVTPAPKVPVFSSTVLLLASAASSYGSFAIPGLLSANVWIVVYLPIVLDVYF
jgi:hypothetical protein